MKISPRVLVVLIALNLVLLAGVVFLVVRGPEKMRSATDSRPLQDNSAKAASPRFPAQPLFPSQAGQTSAEVADQPQTVAPLSRGTASIADQSSESGEEAMGSLPAIFMEPGAELKLNEEQMEAIDNLRQKFVDSVGGENQDPSNPEYLRRWRQVQPVVDSQLRALLGADAFNRLQFEAARQQSNLSGQ